MPWALKAPAPAQWLPRPSLSLPGLVSSSFPPSDRLLQGPPCNTLTFSWSRMSPRRGLETDHWFRQSSKTMVFMRTDIIWKTEAHEDTGASAQRPSNPRSLMDCSCLSTLMCFPSMPGLQEKAQRTSLSVSHFTRGQVIEGNTSERGRDGTPST